MKEKKEKKGTIRITLRSCYLFCAAGLMLAAAVMLLKGQQMGFAFLCLGSMFLCFSGTVKEKEESDHKDGQEE